MRTGEIYRQGDVLLVRVDKAPKGKRISRERGRLVLAYGEVTGHAHVITSRRAEGIETDLGERFYRVLAQGGVALTHEEHDTIVLPQGDYQDITQVEHSPWGVRQVAD
jgi:hypothetical protein